PHHAARVGDAAYVPVHRQPRPGKRRLRFGRVDAEDDRGGPLRRGGGGAGGEGGGRETEAEGMGRGLHGRGIVRWSGGGRARAEGKRIWWRGCDDATPVTGRRRVHRRLRWRGSWLLRHRAGGNFRRFQATARNGPCGPEPGFGTRSASAPAHSSSTRGRPRHGRRWMQI